MIEKNSGRNRETGRASAHGDSAAALQREEYGRTVICGLNQFYGCHTRQPRAIVPRLGHMPGMSAAFPFAATARAYGVRCLPARPPTVLGPGEWAEQTAPAGGTAAPPALAPTQGGQADSLNASLYLVGAGSGLSGDACSDIHTSLDDDAHRPGSWDILLRPAPLATRACSWLRGCAESVGSALHRVTQPNISFQVAHIRTTMQMARPFHGPFCPAGLEAAACPAPVRLTGPEVMTGLWSALRGSDLERKAAFLEAARSSVLPLIDVAFSALCGGARVSADGVDDLRWIIERVLGASPESPIFLPDMRDAGGRLRRSLHSRILLVHPDKLSFQGAPSDLVKLSGYESAHDAKALLASLDRIRLAIRDTSLLQDLITPAISSWVGRSTHSGGYHGRF